MEKILSVLNKVFSILISVLLVVLIVVLFLWFSQPYRIPLRVAIVEQDNLQAISDIQLSKLAKTIEYAINSSSHKTLVSLSRAMSIFFSFLAVVPLIVTLVTWLSRETIFLAIAKKIDKYIESVAELAEVKKDFEEEKKDFEEKYRIISNTKFERELRFQVKKQLSNDGLEGNELEKLKEGIKEVKGYAEKAIFIDTKNFFIDKFKEYSFEEFYYQEEFRSVGNGIPIFESIIESEEKRDSFESRAFLAYSIIYVDNYPEVNKETLESSIKLLSEAIDIREELNQKKDAFYWYEFKRAVFKLHLIDRFGMSYATEIVSGLYEEIKRDISIAMEKNPVTEAVINQIQDFIGDEDKLEDMNERFLGRYITRYEFNLLHTWLHSN